MLNDSLNGPSATINGPSITIGAASGIMVGMLLGSIVTANHDAINQYRVQLPAPIVGKGVDLTNPQAIASALSALALDVRDLQDERAVIDKKGHEINDKFDGLLDYSGTGLGGKWAEALAEVIGGKKSGNTPPIFKVKGAKNTYEIQPSYNQMERPAPNRVLELAVFKDDTSTDEMRMDYNFTRPLADAGISSDISDESGRWYKIQIPIDSELPEKIEKALIKKRMRDAEAKGEIKGDASKEAMRQKITAQVEKEIWGDLAQGRGAV